ncbi:unnamed protein product [Phytomonas sp. Hart1]|nr:unnamed protein product [Phytomonas sp. Hart1]|eukprot:CCW66829.1 unnamed protein product [Phytomonas sp. isolate Hart1]
MEKRDVSEIQEQPIQHPTGPNNDSQRSLLQLLAPFVDAAPPGKLSEVVFSLKSLLIRLLALRNHRASPNGQIPDVELHDFLQICLPALCLRRILQKNGSIVSLAATKLPQVRDQLFQGIIYPGGGKASSGLAQRKIHLMLSRTNHLLSWVMRVNSMKKDVGANGYVCDANQLSNGSASSSYPQGSIFSTSLSDPHASLSAVEALLSYGDDAKSEIIFPWLSDLTETSDDTLESNVLQSFSTEIGRIGRKIRFNNGFEKDDNAMSIMVGLKKFFSHVPSIFVVEENEDVEVCDGGDNSCSSQKRTSNIGDGEVEEDEDLFRDLYAVSYGFDRIANVFFDLHWGLYVEVDVIMGHCIRVISFSVVDETFSSSQDSLVSLFYAFHEELKLQRQYECKDGAKEVVEPTKNISCEENSWSVAADFSNELEAKIPLFDPLFLGVRKKLETELQTQSDLFDGVSSPDVSGINKFDKGDVVSRLLREYHEKWSATGATRMKGSDISASAPPFGCRSKDHIAIGVKNAFTAVVWPREFPILSKLDSLPEGPTQADPPIAPTSVNSHLATFPDHLSQDLNHCIHSKKLSVWPSRLSVTSCKSQGAPVKGWCSIWTSHYELCRADMDSVSQSEFYLHTSCEGDSILDNRRSCYRKTSSSGAGDSHGASSLTLPGKGSREPNQRCNMFNDGFSSSEPPDAITREACWLAFSATSEVWLYYNATACAGTGSTSTEFMNSSSEEGQFNSLGDHQGTLPTFPEIPGGMHQRWIVNHPSEGLSTVGSDVTTVADAVVSKISEHERMVRDSVIRTCNGILKSKHSIGFGHVHEGKGSSLSCLLPRSTPFFNHQTHFDPMRYDDSILRVSFHIPSQEES